jgi:hypothetical protein
MRIIVYSILSILVISSILSCSKGSVFNEPKFGSILLTKISASNFTIIQGENNQLSVGNDVINMISGNNRFRFYENDMLLLDTLLSVEPFNIHPYVLFKPNENARLRIFDSSLNGLYKEALPDYGNIKISLANFSNTLPDKVNVYMTTTTFTAGGLREIQVGEFLGVSGAFSVFQSIITGKNELLTPISVFNLTIKDSADQKILGTAVLNLADINSAGVFKRSVYLIYLSSENNANVLMSK